ncbi:DUF6065 family protein [Ktedonobacter robiniae]|uniref:Uncharacterized protein n=1 Tax=Ktedonobacter robiniae TaxID=2778365 RepID=A0ABQ3UYC5_9CHLR|nr:DUF6065 family protein [Ktedonobacter robiniae]GHO57854.1 hypothetical protein KSB_63290 [Ktedonobacter robiniae]
MSEYDQNIPTDPIEDDSAQSTKVGDETTLIAFCLQDLPPMDLVPAPSKRSWMTSTDKNFASRCLPLLIANQAGWFILNNQTFCATWNGNDDASAIHIEYLNTPEAYVVQSHFGYGILTWNVPYLFRTSPGYNLLVRGPANWPKDGVYPLEGIVETDWANATFTVNWKITRPNAPIIFEAKEPLCMLVPQKRGELENFQTEMSDITSNSPVEQGYLQWYQSRDDFLKDLTNAPSDTLKSEWQKDYFRGIAPGGVRALQHQQKLILHEFKSPDSKS